MELRLIEHALRLLHGARGGRRHQGACSSLPWYSGTWPCTCSGTCHLLGTYSCFCSAPAQTCRSKSCKENCIHNTAD